MQSAKAKTKIEGVDAGLNQKLGLGSSQALSWKSSDLETWIQAIQTALVPFKGPGVSRAPSPPLAQVIHSPL
jgi:hypothetical protein